MHLRFWMTAMMICLFVSAPAGAQMKGDPYSMFGGISPKDLVYKPIDPSNSHLPPSTPSKITLGGVLSKLGIPFVGPRTPQLPGAVAPGAAPNMKAINSIQPMAPIMYQRP
jgi:hypothetical protein